MSWMLVKHMPIDFSREKKHSDFFLTMNKQAVTGLPCSFPENKSTGSYNHWSVIMGCLHPACNTVGELVETTRWKNDLSAGHYESTPSEQRAREECIFSWLNWSSLSFPSSQLSAERQKNVHTDSSFSVGTKEKGCRGSEVMLYGVNKSERERAGKPKPHHHALSTAGG